LSLWLRAIVWFLSSRAGTEAALLITAVTTVATGGGRCHWRQSSSTCRAFLVMASPAVNSIPGKVLGVDVIEISVDDANADRLRPASD
jgi:hypothetical protein